MLWGSSLQAWGDPSALRRLVLVLRLLPLRLLILLSLLLGLAESDPGLGVVLGSDRERREHRVVPRLLLEHVRLLEHPLVRVLGGEPLVGLRRRRVPVLVVALLDVPALRPHHIGVELAPGHVLRELVGRGDDPTPAAHHWGSSICVAVPLWVVSALH